MKVWQITCLVVLVAAFAVWPEAAFALDQKCTTDHLRGPEWAKVDARTANVRFWVKEARDQPLANRLAGEVDRRVWPRFKALLGREPLSDEAVVAVPGCWNGGDGRVDVYLGRERPKGIPAEDDFITIPYVRVSCAARPAFIYLNPGAGPPNFALSRYVLAHELFHAFQYAFHQGDGCIYEPWSEALAEWGAVYAFPSDPERLHHARVILEKPTELLHLSYGAWTFLYSVTKSLRRPEIIRDILLRMEQQADDEAVNAALPGGFAKRFPEFALYAWNQHPIGETRLRVSFREWLSMPFVPVRGSRPQPIVRQVRLGDKDRARYPVLNYPRSFSLHSLSRDYQRFRIEDGKIREVVYENTLARLPNASVRAFVQLDGKWELQDWSNRAVVKFCRDDEDQHVTDIIVVSSNTAFVADPKLALEPEKSPALRVRDVCSALPTRWTGQIGWGASSREQSARGEKAVSINVTGTVSFAAITKGPWRSRTHYEVVGGSVGISAHGSETSEHVRCEWEASGSYVPKRGGFQLHRVQRRYTPYFYADGDGHTLVGEQTCRWRDGNVETSEYSLYVDDVLFPLSREDNVQVTADLTAISGSSGESASGSLADGTSFSRGWYHNWSVVAQD